MIPELDTQRMWLRPRRCCTCFSPDLGYLCKWLAGPMEVKVDLGRRATSCLNSASLFFHRPE
jgi:hypothetical protein